MDPVTGTPSDGLVDLIAATYPGIAGSPWEAGLGAWGTLDNDHFLTGGLAHHMAADTLLIETMNALLAALESAYPGVGFTVSGPGSTYLDTRAYALDGDVLANTPNPGDRTVVFGVAVVDFYRVTMTVDAPAPASVPEPGTALLPGAGLAGLGLRRRLLGRLLERRKGRAAS